MKKIFLCSVLAMMIAIGFTSCQKEGPIGPAGTAGANGTNGSNGEDGKDGANGTNGKDGINGKNGTDGRNGIDGNMKIIVKDFSTTSASWNTIGNGVQVPLLGRFYYDFKAQVSASEITSGILNGGAVLIYHRQSSGTKLMPYTYMKDGDIEYSVWSDVNIGSITVYIGYSAYRQTSPGVQNFRAVIIPGAISGRIQSSNRTVYSVGQLRSMSYEEVCTALNIR